MEGCCILATDIIELIRNEFTAAALEMPLYKRLKTAIESAVRSNAFKSGSALPGERSIAEALSLSRVTVRKALAMLEEEGMLSRRQGARSEIGNRVEKSLSTLTSFSEDLRARGMEPGCVWLSKQLSRPSPTEMMALGISANAQVLRMRRVRTADGAPIAVEHAAVPVRFLPRPLPSVIPYMMRSPSAAFYQDGRFRECAHAPPPLRMLCICAASPERRS